MLTTEFNFLENSKYTRIDYEYNSKNILRKMNCKDENGTKYIHNITYEFDKNNRQTAKYIDDVLTESFEYKFDSLTNISIVSHYLYEEGQKTDVVISYFQFNRMLVQQYQKNYQNNWDSYSVYYYNEKQRLEKEINTTDNTLTQYSYNDNDLIKEFRFFENQKTLRSGSVYKYVKF